MDLASRISSNCLYCSQIVDNDDFLLCTTCKNNVHVKCLKRPGTPGDILGDVFFDFTCGKCSETLSAGPSTSIGREKFIRRKLPWLMVITLAIYNLSLKSNGLSRHGYFHWRSHIVSFIDKNWDYLFDPATKRRKKWIGSVSGALSINSPDFFLSGQEVFQETGWWKLTHSNQTPTFCYKLYEKLSMKRQQLKNEKRLAEDTNYSSDFSNDPELKRSRRDDSDDEIDSCSRTLPYMGCKPKPIKQLNIIDDESNKHLNTVQSSLMDFLAENLSTDNLLFNDIPNIVSKNDLLPLITQTDNSSFFDVGMTDKLQDDPEGSESPTQSKEPNYKSFYQTDKPTQTIHPETGVKSNEMAKTEFTRWENEENLYQPRIVQVTNFQLFDATADQHSQEKTFQEEYQPDVEHLENDENRHLNEHHNDIGDDGDDNEEDDNGLALEACKKSFFTKRTRRELPWLVEPNNQSDDDDYSLDNTEELADNEKLVLMSEYEEKELHNKLRKIFSLEQKCKLKIPQYVRRFYRKLEVRELKRTYSKPLFNLDAYKNTMMENDVTKANILDRFQLITNSTSNKSKAFYARIAGSFQYELFESPYTSRVLHPFIYRNTKCFPQWLKLMCEIQYAVHGNTPSRSTIDFCYVRPNHIAAVNALLQTVFWAGIDMSECLSYPDFSVVALYKKLVVGCAFLVPDVGFNEAYISFMAVRPGWQRSGIASFMLYHLIQTCMSKDITLHVSATNPAVCLYQKFGFKIEEVILDFYEKYLPIDSKHSRNAFFLRLMR